ncbi:acyl-CoA thioesterase [Roseospirillum parvum]|uniref:Acyl-CoA hydrolase n=1 Tax=Roseospirillum parvum TaxID=83401 RepID=A0A1G7ZLT8_9PROT|nr:acyl-CoA thioesterase [Roseospirillum parvum]SDH09619.1 Acyl-CoA hydrolase [Roseospirillum parvum]
MPDPTILTEMILPDQANHYGTLFGGRGLSLMTRAAFVAASRHAREKVVLVACHDARFDEPVPMGSLFVLGATVVGVGRSSMRVHVEGVCERPEAGTRRQVSQATFTMVAVDAAGRPVPVPPLEADAA